jgi:hypothetical protein
MDVLPAEYLLRGQGVQCGTRWDLAAAFGCRTAPAPRFLTGDVLVGTAATSIYREVVSGAIYSFLTYPTDGPA